MLNFLRFLGKMRKINQNKKMVPTSKKELNKPKSRKAIDCKGTNAKKAPTVVILPTKSGITISRKALRLLGVCDR